MMKKFNFCLAIGLLLCAAAFGLTAYNISVDRRAGEEATSALSVLASVVSDNAAALPTAAANAGTAEETDAAESADPEEQFVPYYILDPEREMPTQQIDGKGYIGVLELPAVSLTLPILQEWDYPSLNVAPCRYSGSAYSNGFVIAGHNYDSHFGRISSLTLGDSVRFTDVDGNVFNYVVVAVETLDPYATDEMMTSAYALTLFTCTLGGQYRVTVRCDRAE